MRRPEKIIPYASIGSNICWSIRKQLNYAPAVFYMQMLRVPLNVGLAFLGIYLPSLVVAEVTGNRGFSHAAVRVGGVLFIIFLATILKTVFDRLMDAKETPYRCQIAYELNKKSMGCFYQIYEKKEMRDLRERAKQATEMWDGVQPLRDMTKHAWDFAESILCYLLFGTVVSFVSPWLLVFLTLAPAVNWFCVRAYQKWEYVNRKNWMEIDRKLDYVQGKTANFAVAKDIRIYGMAGWMRQMYQLLSRNYMVWDKRRIFREYLSHLADLVVILLRDGTAYAVLISMTWAGKIRVDQFVLYFAAISSFAEWIGNILNKWNQMRHTSLRFCDLREYLEYPDVDGNKNLSVDKEIAPEIVFDHVSFRYEGEERDTLHDICLTIKSGEKIALVGLNGAGKTTVVKLMCGLYDPTEGEILLNGINIKEYNRKEYFGLFSAVFQDFTMLSASVAENITGQVAECMDKDRMFSCMKKAGIYEKIMSLKERENTLFGRGIYEEAVDFSGGERQKLALAKALYKDAPVLLLDEPTAALDAIAEQEMYLNYVGFSEGKSSLFISHRLASTRFCDRIILLSDGGILECGSHEELMELNGEYAKLFHIQSGYYNEGKEGKKIENGEWA